MKTIITVFLFLLIVCAEAQAQTDQQSWQIQPGVVLDGNRGQVYVMRDGGGMEALELTSGASRWRSSQADLPTGVLGGQVLARVDNSKAGELKLALLNPESGDLLREYNTLLPEAVIASVDHGLGREFSVLLDANNINWDYRYQRIKGRPELASQVPVLNANNQQTVDVKINNPVQNLFGQLQLEDDFSALRVLGESDQQSFTPKPADLLVNLINEQEGRQFRSVSSRYILVSQRSTDNSNILYDWRVFRSDGRFVGQVRMPYSFLPFELADNYLLVVTPPVIRAEDGGNLASKPSLPSLQAVDLALGNVIWQYPLRDIKYRGPFPH